MDSGGDQVGRVRDVVVQSVRARRIQPPLVKGLVVELFARQRVFLPMARVRSIDAAQVLISGVVNTRRFSRRDTEDLVIDELFDSQITRTDGKPAVIFDIAMRPVRGHDWELSEVALREPGRMRRLGRTGHITIVEWRDLRPTVSDQPGGAEQLVAEFEAMKAADVAKELHDLHPERRVEVALALDDETLADALQELPEDEQVEVLGALEPERAADILEEMDPDDAADLINDLDPQMAEELLQRMEPEEAKDVRRLLVYAEFTAGGMMTPEPVIVSADARVADALALVREPDLPPALASMVFVCRTPLETPTGRLLGGVHFQRMLREPPSTLVSSLVDSELEPLDVNAAAPQVARYFATYNLVIAPVVDEERRLLGAVTVDDVLDHILPEDWRDQEMAQPAQTQSAPPQEVTHG